MANQITDQRTLISNANAVTNYDDLTGSAAGTLDNEIFIYDGGGTGGSIGQYTTTTRDGLLYDAGSAQNWASNVFYIWINCGIVGLLDTKANGGLTIRFCGATVTDWFEVYVAGSDDWPPSVQGGWTMFVVDIETARSTAVTNGWTNGTTPATSAIRYVGYSAITSATMPRMVDNTWMDAIWRLPDGTEGIRVEGRNGGTTDWAWADIASTSVTNAWGMSKITDGGGIALNAPVQFFIDDASTHAFSDTNATILWENQEFVPDDVYGITVLGAASGTANFSMGLKTGTGDDATGSQGGAIQSASDGPRWFLDIDAANIDSVDFYGCSFQHAADMQVDNANAEIISCLFIDCDSCTAAGIGEFLRNQIIDANTADGVAFLIVNDITTVVFCTFFFSDGHAIQISGGAASQTSKGNRFNGYGATATNDAALANSSGAAKTITLSDGALLSEHTYRDVGAGSDTTIVANAVTLQLTAIDTDTNTAIQGVEALVRCESGGSFPARASVSITRSGSTATVTHTGHGLATSDLVLIEDADQPEYNGIHSITFVSVNSYTFAVDGAPATPATGAPVATLVLISAITNGSGVVSATRSYGSNQPFSGIFRKGTVSPVYVTAEPTGSVNSASGLTANVPMSRDE